MMVFLCLASISGALIILICGINLFNASLPIPILDGRHVIKAVLFSIGYRLGIIFYIFGFILSTLFFLFVINSPVFLFVYFFLYQDFKVHLRSKAGFEETEKALAAAEEGEKMLENLPDK